MADECTCGYHNRIDWLDHAENCPSGFLDCTCGAVNVVHDEFPDGHKESCPLYEEE